MESFCSHYRLTPHSGFTVIELLMVMGIVTIIMGVTLSNQGSFNKTLILANTAYDIALTMRLAETYGLKSRDIATVTASGYGLHFESASPASFTLFRDSSPLAEKDGCHGVPLHEITDAPNVKTGNCVFAPSEKISDYELGNNITISNFCAYSTISNWLCKSGVSGAPGGLTSLDIVFIRPEPVPSIFINGDISTEKRTRACLTISSAGSLLPRFVSIESSGLIAVSATAGCPTL
jgi:prepilin-type N-terminal cleavage/methylation domain-containing protein